MRRKGKTRSDVHVQYSCRTEPPKMPRLEWSRAHHAAHNHSMADFSGSVFRSVLWLNDTFLHPTAKVSEEVNRKCHHRNTTV